MYRILKIGMDVHTTNYTLCALESKFGEEDVIWPNTTRPGNRSMGSIFSHPYSGNNLHPLTERQA